MDEEALYLPPRVPRCFDVSKTKQHSPNMFEARVAVSRQITAVP